MTEEEAEQGLLDAESENVIKFCPLISAICKPHCVCYMKGYVTRLSGGSYVFYKSNCRNKMFFGE